METIKLKKPFTSINGDEITELNLDFDAVTVGDFFAQDTIAKELRNDRLASASDVRSSTLMMGRGIDRASMVALGWLAAMKTDKRLMIEDVKKVWIRDSQAIEDAAFFFYQGVD